MQLGLSLMLFMIAVTGEAFADRTQRTVLPPEMVGYYEAGGYGLSSYGRDCSQTDWLGGNQRHKMHVSDKGVTYKVRQPVRSAPPSSARYTFITNEWAFKDIFTEADESRRSLSARGILVVRGHTREKETKREVWTLHEIENDSVSTTILLAIDTTSLDATLWFKCRGR